MKKSPLFNKTKNLAVTENLFIATNVFERLRGLLGKKEMAEDEALLIPNCNSIHTFFMNFAIDVVFIDKSHQVVSISNNVKPWKLLLPRLKATKTIEFKSGFVNSNLIEIGDQLDVSA